MAASMISLPVMEASAARVQSEKKRPKVALNAKIFKTAIDAVQGQTTTPSPSLDPQRKTDRPSSAAEVCDDCRRVTESRSESDVVPTSGGSCSVDQPGRGRSDNQLVIVETSCSSDSKHHRENAGKGSSGPIVDRLFKSEDDRDAVDSRLDRPDHSWKRRDFRRPEYVRTVRSADQESLVERRQPLNRGEVEQQRNKDFRSSDHGRKEQRARDHRSSECGHAERQNEDFQSGRGKKWQNNRGHRPSYHARIEQQTFEYRSSEPKKMEERYKDYCLYGEKREQPNRERRSLDREKINLQVKGSRSSDCEKIEHLSKDKRSSGPDKVEQQSKESQSSGTEKVDQQSKEARSSSPEKVEQQSKEARSSSPEKVEQQSKVARSSSPEKVEQQSKVVRSSSPEKVEQQSKESQSGPEKQSKEAQSSGQDKVEQQSKESQSSAPDKVEQQSKESQSSDPEKVVQQSKESQSSDPEKVEQQSKESQSSDPEKVVQQSKETQSSGHEKVKHPSKDRRSANDGKVDSSQNRDHRSNRGAMVQRGRGNHSLSGSLGSHGDHQQQHEFRDDRGRQQRGRGRRNVDLYHYDKVLKDNGRHDNAVQNADYRRDDAGKPHIFVKQKRGKNGSSQGNDKASLTSSEDVAGNWDQPEIRIQSGGPVRGKKKSRRGAGALGLDLNSRHLGSRESVQTERSNEGETDNADVERRGHGNSSARKHLAAGCGPEQKSPKKTHEGIDDKKSHHAAVDLPNNGRRERTNAALLHSDAPGVVVYNRGRGGRALRGRGNDYSTRSLEHLSFQSRRVTSHDDDSRRNSTSIDDRRRGTEGQRRKSYGRTVWDAPRKSVATGVAPEKSVGVSTQSSKRDTCDYRATDKELCSNFNSNYRSEEDLRSNCDQPVIAVGAAKETPSQGMDGGHCTSDRKEVSAMLNSDDNSGSLSSCVNMLSRMEFTNTFLRNAVSSPCHNIGAQALCSILSVLDTTSSTATPSLSSTTMDAHVQIEDPAAAQDTPAADIYLPADSRDALATPTNGCFQPQEVNNVNSQGFSLAESRSRESENIRSYLPPHCPPHEGSFEMSYDPQAYGYFNQYPNGQLQMPYGMPSTAFYGPPFWNNYLAMPSPGLQFRTPMHTSNLQQSVRPFRRMLRPAPNPQATHGYGSGRFLHTPPVTPYHPPEPMSPAPDPRSLIQAAFQLGNNLLENLQATAFQFSSPHQAPLALPSTTTPSADSWSTAAQNSVCGYYDGPPNQPDIEPATTSQAVPQLTPALNLTPEEHQDWMDCYIKARDTHDEYSILRCRRYWYDAVYLPSLQVRADGTNSPAVAGSDPQNSLEVEAGADPSQTGMPPENSETSVESVASAKGARNGHSEWKPVNQEASAGSAKSGASECCSSDTPPRTFSGIAVKNWKGSGGAAVERMRMKCKRLSYRELDATEVTPEAADASSTKTVKKFKVERAGDQESGHNSRRVSFHMSTPRPQRSLENQSGQMRGRLSDGGRSDDSDRPKYQATRRSSSSALSEALSCVENSEWMDWKTQFRQTTESATLPYIDSHCHLDFLFRRSGFAGTFKEYRNEQADTFPSNFLGCVAIFCQPLIWSSYLAEDSFFNLLLTEENIWAAVGCHPKSAMDFNARTEMNLRQLLKHERVKALGEVGLDYSGNYAQYRDVQIDVLQRQVTTAVKLNKPLVIHARDAEHEIAKVLEKLVPKNYKIHRHCFLGSWGEAEAWFQKFPYSYIGLTPAVTHSKHHPGLRDLMWHLPLDKLLLETDAPYFIPSQIPIGDMPFSHPGLAITVAVEVARVKQLPVNDVLSACLRNTREMYDL